MIYITDDGEGYLQSSRRRVITLPRDNIGVACMPAKNQNFEGDDPDTCEVRISLYIKQLACALTDIKSVAFKIIYYLNVGSAFLGLKIGSVIIRYKFIRF